MRRLINGRRPILRFWTVSFSFELALSLAVLLTGAGRVPANELPADSIPVIEPSFASTLSIEKIKLAMAEVEQSNASVDVKLQVADNYKAAIKNLESAAASDARLQALIAETASVGERAAQQKKQRAELKNKKTAVDATLTLQELEQLLPSTELQLATLKKAKVDAEAELQSRSPRRKEIRERIAVVQEKIGDSQTQLRSLSTAEPTAQSQSLVARLASRRVTLEKEKPALEAELTKFDAEESADLIRLRMELAALNAADTEKTIVVLQRTDQCGS